MVCLVSSYLLSLNLKYHVFCMVCLVSSYQLRVVHIPWSVHILLLISTWRLSSPSTLEAQLSGIWTLLLVLPTWLGLISVSFCTFRISQTCMVWSKSHQTLLTELHPIVSQALRFFILWETFPIHLLLFRQLSPQVSSFESKVKMSCWSWTIYKAYDV